MAKKVSIKEIPFSKEEIKEMEKIQEEKYWNRKPLKQLFCDKYNRMMVEVDDYFKKNKKPPLTGTGKVGGKYIGLKNVKGEEVNLPDTPIARSVSRALESVRAPKEQVKNTPGTIEVAFKRMTVEGNKIIFEL